ncbi:hypothetical protein R3P38DRAFT_2557338 [Favolaschia claudopus]|uniref:Uncharacterized protein n=1 Tax=Favolaschia claudopus TaxID=2862362 RepID=A0AAW0A950_9AGAR
MTRFSFGLLVFSTALVAAQNSSDLGSIERVDVPAGNTIKAGDFITYGYFYNPEQVFRQLRNITSELMIGAAEENGTAVASLMSVHGNDLGSPISDDIGFWLHAATPPGNYHIRVNGTVFDTSKTSTSADPGTPLGPLTARSKTWILSQPDAFACTVPQFTPIVSVADSNYSPLQLGQPLAGMVYYLNNISTVGTITVAPSWVDVTFGGGLNIPQMTMEVVKSPSLDSVGSVILNSTSQAYQFLPIDKFKLEAGAFKIRANFTDKNHAGNFVTLSDEFYIASGGNCAGLQSGNSTTSGGGSSGDGKQSAPPKGAAVSSMSIPFTGLAVLFVSFVAGVLA